MTLIRHLWSCRSTDAYAAPVSPSKIRSKPGRLEPGDESVAEHLAAEKPCALVWGLPRLGTVRAAGRS